MDILLVPQMGEADIFSLSFNPESLTMDGVADTIVIAAQAQIKPSPNFWRKYQRLTPEIFSFHGTLFDPQSTQNTGAFLTASNSLPLSFPHEHAQSLDLAFHCSRSYLQYIEDRRPNNSIVSLGVSLRGIASLSASQQGEETVPLQSAYLGKLLSIQTQQPYESVRISLSHWQDMLASIGYPQRRYIELPMLASQEWDEAFQGAINHLNQAHTLFASGKYREAVQRCRQSRDALLGADKVTWSANVLEPVLGAEKAKMIDESIRALNNLGHASSHGNGIEVDRDTASYVIGSLTLILNYIGLKLK